MSGNEKLYRVIKDTNSGDDIQIGKMTITESGNVGIGTEIPIYPLHIKASITNTTNVRLIRLFEETGLEHRYIGDTSGENITSKLSAKFSNGLWISQEGVAYGESRGVIYSSDERIKKDITIIDDDLALKKVIALESKEYNYKCRETKHKTIGFIAQEVLEILPEAVSFHNHIIPDEMRIISEPQWDNNILTIPDLDMTLENITGKCRFFVYNDLNADDTVMKEIDCEKDASGNKTNMFKFDKQWTNVLFHGKEVNDFHTIDKNQIFALHHSAIQELSRKNDAKTEKIQTLENEVNTLKEEMTTIKEKIALL